MRCVYMVIERDPEAAWLVVSAERREVLLEPGVDFHAWALRQRPAENVELKLLYASAT
jgi:hypothetical protein